MIATTTISSGTNTGWGLKKLLRKHHRFGLTFAASLHPCKTLLNENKFWLQEWTLRAAQKTTKFLLNKSYKRGFVFNFVKQLHKIHIVIWQIASLLMSFLWPARNWVKGEKWGPWIADGCSTNIISPCSTRQVSSLFVVYCASGDIFYVHKKNIRG